MNNIIGNKLKSLRKQKGFSQEQVSGYLHISQSAYARIENGDSHSWSTHIDKICEVFEITPEELVKQENIVVNSNQTGGHSTNAIVVNQLSERLIEQYEKRLKEKDEIIEQLMSKIK
ncbi:helix-turn-helix domain-containing protein [Flavobacterium amniphilum]|jgi:transcriptional regulator with XRE-family HTH domain|uniref:helix-turn-helix domain-containing protein n=1 Tax=Flavobacterium amniphilum TaxID=1834035 RepID=UPI002029DE43|nr:helix-turn-helix transcriptional regulator [Flavobacterium amniphilum]MCL9807162.1 helix-turn-helix domain-containing protein [Flavobacterium amniphilum]